ncbi:MAG: hypothetical protein HS115_18420 [Spirochaetales bacterium]|nr:hypothetical protein [Spirochaetales bacterium]
MIERMRKVTFFLHHRARYDALLRLQELGLVHLDLEEGTAEKIKKLKSLIARHEKVIAGIEKLHEESDGEGMESSWPRHVHSPDDRLKYLEDLFEIKESFEKALLELEAEERLLSPWGDFDVLRVSRLANHGLRLRFFIGTASHFQSHEFGNQVIEVIHRDGARLYFVLLEYGPQQSEVVLPFQEVILPSNSLHEIREVIATVRQHIADDERQLASWKSMTGGLIEQVADLRTQLQYEEARLCLKAAAGDTIYYITGWVPEAGVQQLKRMLEEQRIAYQLEKPGPSDAPPVKLRNNRFSRLFEPITRIFSLPDYFELDPTLFFAPFFTLFFGLCLGDVGYGLILTAISLICLKIVPPAYRMIAWLGIILSLSTTVAGVLLNSVFGAPLLAGSPAMDLAVFSPYTSAGKTAYPAMSLSLALGFVQLTTGIILSAVNAWRRHGWLYALKSSGSLGMLLGGLIVAAHADPMGLGLNAALQIGPLPVGALLTAAPENAGLVLLGAGAFLFFFFNSPELSIFLRPLSGLWAFYQFATGLLGDFLSYIRLFALGLASGLLGNAFNQIAFMILPRGPTGPEFQSPWIVLAVLILILGHTLNLGLAVLGAFVHPLRLTFVEFYKNMEYAGGGRAYTPFAVQRSLKQESV